MKRWMTDRHGKIVTTVQTDKRTGSDWAPGARTVDASRATYVLLDGSRRDYKGMKTVYMDETTLTVEDEFHRVEYRLV